MHLHPGTLLQGGKYRIVRFIKSGGFGCTYEAVHTVFGKRVAIKEFFPKDFCNRDSDALSVTVGTQNKKPLVAKLKKKFIDEAVVLNGLDHSGIVRVSDVFEENDTAYYVMDYIDGGSLSCLVDRDGPLAEPKALEYIREICSALEYVHSRNRLHLDLKPGNIMLDSAGHTILIDFGTSKQYDEVNGENTSTLVGQTPGYAPLEMSQRGGVSHFTPSTDIYSLGATLYKLLTGERPPEASEVNENGLPALPPRISPAVRNAIEKAMSPRRKDRPQSVAEFRRLLGTAPTRPRVVIGEETQRTELSGQSRTEPRQNTRDRQSGPSRSNVTPKGPGVSNPVKPEPASAKPRRGGLVWGVIAGVLAIAALFLSLTYVPDEVQQDRDRYGDLISRAELLASDGSHLSEVKAVYDSAAVYELKYAASRHSGRFNASASQKSADIQSKIDDAEKQKEELALAEKKRLREERKRKEKEASEAVPESKHIETSYSNGILRVKGVEYPMVYVHGGSFDMGATAEQGEEAYSRETPVHRVTLKSYYIGKYEVTQELWEAVMGSNPSHFRAARNPVEKVSWNDCQDFIRKLNSLTGQNFRLPTEAEWEFAARGGNNSRGYKYSGDNSLDNLAWYDANSRSTTHIVGAKFPNELGILDMSGNVYEWCSDYYGDYSASSQTDPTGPSKGTNRVYRGGGWSSGAGNCRVSDRSNITPVIRFNFIGFRLCL